jgi:hypothetical protein
LHELSIKKKGNMGCFTLQIQEGTGWGLFSQYLLD